MGCSLEEQHNVSISGSVNSDMGSFHGKNVLGIQSHSLFFRRNLFFVSNQAHKDCRRLIFQAENKRAQNWVPFLLKTFEKKKKERKIAISSKSETQNQ